MDPLSLVLSFIFGTVVGSFLNVVALRFNTGKGINGRSMCMSCGKTLTWKELVPIFSFIAQRGACKKCRSKISWQYPLVEFIAGAIFVLIFFVFPPVSILAAITTLIQIIAGCLLLVISVYDIKHKIIPDSMVYTFDFLALVSLFVGGLSWWHVPSFATLLAGPILALPFALLWLVSKGTWMGLGDAKLVLGIGWFLGINGGVNALVLAFWIAAVISVVWLFAAYGKFKRNTEIPFGPYLILGFYLVLLFGIQVLDVHLLKDIILSYL
jgi:prepilin signal peptidase PulO-like enzyme (type II secretory pathway)